MHKVFVYGTLKQGHGNNRILTLGDNPATFVGEAMTTDVFGMTKSGFPFVIHPEHAGDIEPKRIKGELYEADDRRLAACDRLESYYGPGKNNFYNRETIEVVTEDGQVHETQVYIVNSPNFPRASTLEVCPTTTFMTEETYVY